MRRPTETGIITAAVISGAILLVIWMLWFVAAHRIGAMP